MNFKKFISGVSAFAIAASAFAAMAVTADAKTYTDVTPTSGKQSNVTAKGSGVYTLKGNPGGVVVDFSDLEDIDKATSVTVDFDTKLVASGSTLATLMFGVGDKSVRGLNCGGSNNSGYNRSSGLVTFFGSNDGAHYYINKKGTTDYAAGAKNKVVHTTVTLDRETGAWTADYTVGTTTIPTSGTTDLDNITVVEAFAWNVSQAYDITLANVQVTYTVPDAPAVPVVSSEVVAAQAFTTPDYDEDMVVGVIDLTVSEAAIDLADATYLGQTGTVTGATSFIGEALINVIITGATSTDALNSVVFN